MKKILIAFIVFALFWWVAFYASASFIAKSKPQFHVNLSTSIFLWEKWLDGTILWYKSGMDISEYRPFSNCDIETKFLGEAKNVYFYYINYKDICYNNTLVLQKGGVSAVTSLHTLNFFKKFDIYNKFMDYPTVALEEIFADLSKKERTLEWYKDINSESATNFLSIQKKRKYDEVAFIRKVISTILESREYPYLIPVPWYKLSTQHSHLPNYSRGYRASYTDGIHHWWDIFTPKGTPVQALDAGIIIHTVKGFQFSDLDQIKRGALSETDKLENLNLLRWNQVWLKTMKWEVVFYSHLEDVGEDIEVGDFVSKWTLLWTIWVSWVPVQWYNEYHLHFAIQENPYNIGKAGKYTLLNYMEWDWLLRGLSIDEVLQAQKDIFVK